MCCKDKNPHTKDCTLDLGRGCMFCNCETEPSVSVCEGCFKLHETDWLEGLPDRYPTDIFEIRFKNTRRSYYRNGNDLDLKKGDVVAVESSPGHDIGIVSLTGDMVAKQMKRVGFTPLNGEFKKIYRKAKPYDIEKWQEAIALEHDTMIRSRQIAAEMGLNMKIGDVEFQGDRIKAIFYYIADERVDFRELIKVFAEQFRIRVEMKQIGARQEAGRIGGLGSCGRELCCASWIASFSSVTTNSARAQEISLNPQKLAGQCSKLKCCLVYELDDYLDARREFPRVNQPLQALDGEYHLVKTDILGRTMSFGTAPGSMAGLVTLPISRVKEIIAVNRTGKKVDRMQDESSIPKKQEESGFADLLGESLTRFDKDRPQGRGRRGRDNRNGEKRTDGQKNSGQGGRDDRRRDNRGDRKPEGQRDGDNRDRQGGGQRQGGQRSGDNRGDRKPEGQRGGDNRDRQGGGQKQGGQRQQGNRNDNRQPGNRQQGGDRSRNDTKNPEGQGGPKQE